MAEYGRHSCVIGVVRPRRSRSPEGALECIPRGWRSRSIKTDEAFGSKCVIGGVGWGSARIGNPNQNCRIPILDCPQVSFLEVREKEPCGASRIGIREF